MSDLSKYPNLIDLFKAGSMGDRSTFLDELESTLKHAENNDDRAFAKLIEETLSSEEGGKVEDKTDSSNKLDAFNKTLKSTKDIPIGLVMTKTNVTMDHVILPDEVKDIIAAFIEEQEHNEKYIKEGLDPRNKCMLIGPPGNGKTALSKAIANRMACPFYFVRYDQLISQKAGETSKRLFAIFDFVKTHRCILFFDEMDAIGKDRGDENEGGEMKRVVSTLLVQLDDIPPHVIILGATNHPGMIDKAVWRRFAVRVNLPNPEIIEYVQYLEMAFERYGHKPKGDLEILAMRLEAENFAEAEVFVEDCIRRWIRADKLIPIEEAIDLSIEGWPKTREKLPS